MAIRKHIVKMNHMEAVVKIVNDADANASVTISLSTDLLKSNEDIVVGVTPKVAIGAIEWSLQDGTGKATITRNGKVTHRLHSSTAIMNAYGADHEESASDIVVDMTGGTIYLRLLKVQGYLGKFQPEQHGGE